MAIILDSFLAKVQYSLWHSSIKSQLSQIRLTLIVCFVAALLTTGFVYLLSLHFGVPASDLTKDPTTVTGSAFYIGLLSSIGLMLSSITAGICCFGALQIRSHPQARFLLVSGLLCILLLLDDAFLLHEVVFPLYLDIPEKVVYLAYLLLLAGYFLYAWRYILATDYFLLVVTFLFWGLSLAADISLPSGNRITFLEDGLKFFGIAFWLAYFWRTTSTALHTHS